MLHEVPFTPVPVPHGQAVQAAAPGAAEK